MKQTQQEVFDNYFGKTKQPPIRSNIGNTPLSEIVPNVVSQRADGNIDLAGFTDKLKDLLNDTWEDGWGEFSDGAPTSTDPDDVVFPQIIFEVDERTTAESKKSIKPRVIEIRVDPDDNNYTLIISRKWFDCHCNFLIAHNTNREAYELMTRFEIFMETYTGYFKRSGISEILFQKECKYTPSEQVLSDKSIKCLKYLIIFERIRVERVRTTKELLSQIKAQTQINNG